MEIKKKRKTNEIMDIEDFGQVLFKQNFVSKQDLLDKIRKESKSRKVDQPSIHDLNKLYLDHPLLYPRNPEWEEYAVRKTTRSQSGITNISVMTKVEFDCEFDCKYCPNQKKKFGAKVDMPRSYTDTAPTPMRAAQNNFDAFETFMNRAVSLRYQGHVVDKVEVFILGGTFSGYPLEYKREFCRDLFYAANTFINGEHLERDRWTLEQEQQWNETAAVKIIGLTIETRPDTITKEEIVIMRELGVTRVQIGVQHTNDDILRKVNRGHLLKHSKKAIQLLRSNGFKIVVHLMPDLPGSSPEMDKEMFDIVVNDIGLKPDETKVYPTMVIEWSELYNWYKEGKYKPYWEKNPKDMEDVLLHYKMINPLWLRNVRTARDLSTKKEDGFRGGFNCPNIRENIDKRAIEKGIISDEIRGREIKHRTTNFTDLRMEVVEYYTSSGKEFYIHWISNMNTLHAHLRLTLNKNNDAIAMNVLNNSAIIREVHTYGKTKRVGDRSNTDGAQHKSLGIKLVEKAEELAVEYGFQKMAVISGVGVRKYYEKKLGYSSEDTYMVKDLTYLYYWTEIKSLPWGAIIFTALSFIILNFYD